MEGCGEGEREGEVLKVVFPLLEGRDLASCMCVCKQWRVVAGDDYFWKCVCSRRWPSTCSRPSLFPAVSYHKLFRTFFNYKRFRPPSLLPPRLSLSDLDFFIDIWDADDRLLFSRAVPGLTLDPAPLDPSTDYKMTLPVHPTFPISPDRTISVSVLVGRRDFNRLACIINRSFFDYTYTDHTSSSRALAFDYLDFSPFYPFISGIRAWVALLFKDGAGTDVAAIQIDFCDVANSKDEVLWLLDMLDWT